MSRERTNEKGVGPYRGFDYLSLFSDPVDLAICNFQQDSRFKDY